MALWLGNLCPQFLAKALQICQIARASPVYSPLHRFSMGFRSGLWLGRSKTLIFFCQSHSFVDLEVCFGSSWWNSSSSSHRYFCWWQLSCPSDGYEYLWASHSLRRPSFHWGKYVCLKGPRWRKWWQIATPCVYLVILTQLLMEAVGAEERRLK